MSLPVEIPQPRVPFVDANGRLTREGIVVFQKMVDAVRDLQDRVYALENP